MSHNNENFNSFSLIQFIWHRRWTFLWVCLATAILSLIVSFLIRPQYKSTAIIYAPRTNSVAKILLNEQTYNERLDMKAYAEEEGTEQMMEILNSREIKDILINKFDLYKHYEINPQAKYARTKIYKNLKSAVDIKRTQYGAIAINVQDRDPQIASDMANEITFLIDSIKHRIDNERAMAAYKALQQQLDSIDREVARIDDSLKMVMEYGVFDFTTQSERMLQQYAIAISQGNNAGVQRLKKELEIMATWGPKHITWIGEQEEFRKYQALCKANMMSLLVDMNNDIPVKFVIEKAIPADKKAYPKKSLIVVFSTLASFIILLIVLLSIDKVKATPVESNSSEENLKR
ncbi:MAG: Wzz/FepE/Etk N-terminal domain-containing protein [Bacteroidales bacterium]|nr:Wzz/FepE/Etk N-terminal domain-containing protein [Bacteroidales bacterium]